jgi:hypothetical protein
MSMQTPSDADQAFEAVLRGTLYRFDCPAAHTLGEYQLDLLGREVRATIAAHLTTCPDCRTELATARAFLAAPAELPTSIAGRARRLFASLVSTPPELAFGGLRGAASLTTRIYAVGEITVTLELADGGAVRGLVVTALDATELTGAHVRLRSPVTGEVVTATTLDDLGTFELEDVTAGEYTLEVDLPNDELVIESVTIPA